MRWEYKFFGIPMHSTIEKVEEQCNKLAEEEWEVIQLLPDAELVFCKRPYYEATVIRKDEEEEETEE